jgi:hypothetical protein
MHTATVAIAPNSLEDNGNHVEPMLMSKQLRILQAEGICGFRMIQELITPITSQSGIIRSAFVLKKQCVFCDV